MAQEFISGRFRSWLDSGAPNAAGRLYTYASGTTTFKAAYTDATLATPCTYTSDGVGGQYILLNARGEAQVWLGSGTYTMVAQTALGAVIDSTDGIVSADSFLAGTLSPTANLAMGGFKLTGLGAGVNPGDSVNFGQLKYTAAISGGVARPFTDKFSDWFNPLDVGAVGNGTTNDSAALNAALSGTGVKVVDGGGRTYKINSSITVPTGVTLQNANLVHGTAGMSGILYSTSSKILNVKVTGTGTTNTVERGLYPAADGVTDVTLDIEVTNMTFGFQAQPISTLVPKRIRGRIYAHDLVGAVGVSEGYGCLLSPAESCDLLVHAVNIPRHAVYLSAGAKHNDIETHVDGCLNYAAQMYSTNAQPATQHNTIRIHARNLNDNTGNSGALAIVQNSHYNTVYLDLEGNGLTQCAALIQGSSGGPYPYGNKVVGGTVTGQFLGADVFRIENADSTIVTDMELACYATFSVISSRTVGTNGTAHGGRFYGNSINAQSQNCSGIYAENTSVPTFIGENTVVNTGTSPAVRDGTSGKRQGFSKRATFSGTTGSITGGSFLDVTATLSDTIAIAGRRTTVWISSVSVDFAARNVIAGGTAVSNTTALFRVYNASGSAQTFNYEGWVEGD